MVNCIVPNYWECLMDILTVVHDLVHQHYGTKHCPPERAKMSDVHQNGVLETLPNSRMFVIGPYIICCLTRLSSKSDLKVARIKSYSL